MSKCPGCIAADICQILNAEMSPTECAELKEASEIMSKEDTPAEMEKAQAELEEFKELG